MGQNDGDGEGQILLPAPTNSFMPGGDMSCLGDMGGDNNPLAASMSGSTPGSGGGFPALGRNGGSLLSGLGLESSFGCVEMREGGSDGEVAVDAQV